MFNISAEIYYVLVWNLKKISLFEIATTLLFQIYDENNSHRTHIFRYT